MNFNKRLCFFIGFFVVLLLAVFGIQQVAIFRQDVYGTFGFQSRANANLETLLQQNAALLEALNKKALECDDDQSEKKLQEKEEGGTKLNFISQPIQTAETAISKPEQPYQTGATTEVPTKPPRFQTWAQSVNNLPGPRPPELIVHDFVIPCVPKRDYPEKSKKDAMLPGLQKALNATITAMNEVGAKYALQAGMLLSWYRDCHMVAQTDLDFWVFDDLDIDKFNDAFQNLNIMLFYRPSLKERNRDGGRWWRERTKAMRVSASENKTFTMNFNYRALVTLDMYMMEFFFLRRLVNIYDAPFYQDVAGLGKWYEPFQLAHAEFLNLTILVPYPPLCHIIEKYGLMWNETMYAFDYLWSRRNDPTLPKLVRDWSSETVNGLINWMTPFGGVTHVEDGNMSGAQLVNIKSIDELKSFYPNYSLEFLTELYKRVSQYQRKDYFDSLFHERNKVVHEPFMNSTTDVPQTYNIYNLTRDCYQNPKKWLEFYNIKSEY